ncbi:recombinase family protein [Liquorilactobacillus nagelii]|jgi:DNA invertase Pin-like site-specific DNA recombinase|uniref:recombinase family protein n=2 Tax=Liquorilactobacillus nagelii TaxID=82688 RepID=UPI0039E8D4A2
MMKKQIKNIINHICYTSKIYELLNQELATAYSPQEIQVLLKKVLLNSHHWKKKGKYLTFYNIDDKLEITINSENFQIVTISKISHTKQQTTITKYGYARVSTADQKLENQIEVLKAAGAEKIYQEKFTGTTTERPEFKKLLAKLTPGDTLIITKLDRFARNTKEALEIIQTLFSLGIKVNILNMGIIDNTPTGQLIFTIFSAFAQFERDMIVTRTQEGKEFAKRNNPNFTEGRPQKYTDKQILFAYKLRQKGLTYKQLEQQTGIGSKTLQRRFKLIK